MPIQLGVGISFISVAPRPPTGPAHKLVWVAASAATGLVRAASSLLLPSDHRWDASGAVHVQAISTAPKLVPDIHSHSIDIIDDSDEQETTSAGVEESYTDVQDTSTKSPACSHQDALQCQASPLPSISEDDTQIVYQTPGLQVYASDWVYWSPCAKCGPTRNPFVSIRRSCAHKVKSVLVSAAELSHNKDTGTWARQGAEAVVG